MARKVSQDEMASRRGRQRGLAPHKEPLGRSVPISRHAPRARQTRLKPWWRRWGSSGINSGVIFRVADGSVRMIGSLLRHRADEIMALRPCRKRISQVAGVGGVRLLCTARKGIFSCFLTADP